MDSEAGNLFRDDDDDGDGGSSGSSGGDGGCCCITFPLALILAGIFYMKWGWPGAAIGVGTAMLAPWVIFGVIVVIVFGIGFIAVMWHEWRRKR